MGGFAIFSIENNYFIDDKNNYCSIRWFGFWLDWFSFPSSSIASLQTEVHSQNNLIKEL